MTKRGNVMDLAPQTATSSGAVYSMISVQRLEPDGTEVLLVCSCILDVLMGMYSVPVSICDAPAQRTKVPAPFCVLALALFVACIERFNSSPNSRTDPAPRSVRTDSSRRRLRRVHEQVGDPERVERVAGAVLPCRGSSSARKSKYVPAYQGSR